jgi:small ligand-binding sensory domain FIST
LATAGSASGGFRAAHATAVDWEAATAACLEDLAPLPDGANVGFLYLTDHLVDSVAEIREALRLGTGIEAWVGSTGIGVCATGIEYFDQPALAVMVGCLPAGEFALFDSARDDLAAFVDQNRPWLDESLGNFGVVHADPRNPEIMQLIPAFAEAASAFLVGALTSSRSAHAQLAGEVTEGGLSGLVVSGQVGVATGLTQGCSPIGEAHVVTEARDNIVVSLDDRPALDVFKEAVGEILARDLSRVAGYIFAVVPVRGADWDDYLVRNLAGFDEREGLLAIAEVLEPGQRLMFCRRDQASAQEDLERMLTGLKGRLDGPPQGALYHTCLARGPNLFGPASQELKAIQAALGEVPLVGFFGNGEISAGRLYTYTGVLSLFR